jgi:hypothetical protein
MTIRIALCGGVVAASMLALTVGVSAQAKKPVPQKASLSFEDKEVRMSAFSGSKIKIGSLWTMDAECKSAQPDIRVVKEPKNGEVSFEELRGPAALPKNHLRAHCDGSRVNGAAVYYESKDGYSGADQFKIEVDYKQGFVRSYTVYMNVR